MIEAPYVVDVRFSTAVTRTKRVIEVAEAFGLGLDNKEFVVFDNLSLEVPEGSVVYITGQSGGGKSVLLRELERQMTERGKSVINLDRVVIDPALNLIDQIGKDNNDAQRLMNLAGLCDAYLWIRKWGELSDGQRYRFRLAKAIECAAQVWVADEFMAILDRTAAKVIAYSMQKVARAAGATLLVATTHTDLIGDLAPSVLVEKRFRERIRVEAFSEIKHDFPDEVYQKLLRVM